MLHIRSSLSRILHRKCRNNLIRATSTSAPSSRTGPDSDGATSNQVQDAKAKPGGSIDPGTFRKLRARRPLVKNFFVGAVDKELLGYPEVIAREEMNSLQNEVLPLRSFFAEEVDTARIDATRSIPPAVLDGARELGLYGLNVPTEYGGKGWGWSESLIATEEEANCTDVALGLLSHRVVADLLKEFATDDQKQRFLSKMAGGAYIATEAIFEYSPPEDDYFNTTAQYNADRYEWTLNGEKSYVVTGPLPSGATPLLLVIAQTQRAAMKGDIARGTTIFLVDGSTPGVKLGEQHLTIGCRGVQMRRVHFEGVTVADSCIVGNPHEGNQVADILLRAGRLRSSMLGVVMAKNMLSDLASYCRDNKQCGVGLQDLEITQTHLSKAMCATYAMESMLYLTAGMLDEFHGQDVGLEAAITKYFTMTQLQKIAVTNLDVIGPKSLHSGQPTEIAFRNAAQLYTQGESIDTLRMFIALTGLQHAGSLTTETVRKQRNPLLHPGHILGRFLQRSNLDNPNTKMRLGDSLHPTLLPAAQCIEHSVARLQMSVELLLTRYGTNIVERHNEMERLADISTLLYAMFASAARASRSYCIGLQLADHELLTALTICSHGRDAVMTLCTEIFNGQYANNDNNLRRMANQVTKSKGHFAVHPLTYNY